MIDALSQVLARATPGTHPLDFKEDLYLLNGRLLLLSQAHAAIQEGLEELLAGDDASSASG